MTEVAIADVIAEQDIARDRGSDLARLVAEDRESIAADLRRLAAFDGSGFDGNVPLEGKVLMGDGGADLLDFAQHRRLVRRANPGAVFSVEKALEPGKRRRQANLKPRAGRNDAARAQRLEYLVRFGRPARISQIVECDGADARPDLKIPLIRGAFG